MNLITEEQITKTFQKFNQLSDNQMEEYIEAFTKQQEVLFAYVMTVDDELSEEERQMMLMLAIQTWFIIAQNTTKIKGATHELLEEIDHKNDQLLERFAQEDDEENVNLEKLFAQHAQPHLLDMLIACLQDDDIWEDPINTENTEFIFIYLLNFLDTLLVSVEE